MNFGLSDAHINQIVAELKKAGVKSAKIYGSRSKGNFRPNSDIDIAVYGTNLNIGAIHEALDELPTPYLFDVTDYYNLKYHPLKDHIDRVGTPLW